MRAHPCRSKGPRSSQHASARQVRHDLRHKWRKSDHRRRSEWFRKRQPAAGAARSIPRQQTKSRGALWDAKIPRAPGLVRIRDIAVEAFQFAVSVAKLGPQSALAVLRIPGNADAHRGDVGGYPIRRDVALPAVGIDPRPERPGARRQTPAVVVGYARPAANSPVNHGATWPASGRGASRSSACFRSGTSSRASPPSSQHARRMRPRVIGAQITARVRLVPGLLGPVGRAVPASRVALDPRRLGGGRLALRFRHREISWHCGTTRAVRTDVVAYSRGFVGGSVSSPGGYSEGVTVSIALAGERGLGDLAHVRRGAEPGQRPGHVARHGERGTDGSAPVRLRRPRRSRSRSRR